MAWKDPAIGLTNKSETIEQLCMNDSSSVKMNILGINMHCLSYAEMYPIYDRWLSDKTSRSHALALINTYGSVSALVDKHLRDIYNSTDLVGIDSMPFLKWARAFYKKTSDRFYAPDLMLQISSKAREKGYTFFLYGGYPEEPARIEEYLVQRFDGIRIVGKLSPPFRPMTEDEDVATCKLINDAHPDFLWIGLGSPKQDVWIRTHLEKIHGCIMVPSGATFDFFGGRVRQAPKWIRDSGFEWFFRLTQDTKRLWMRYTIYNVLFVLAFLMQLTRIMTFDGEGFLKIFGRRTLFGNG
jgi:N-acetylglucosaminyldiphosphoundecaprenol N-acetyl-beta-D-mannosaminyltransferase